MVFQNKFRNKTNYQTPGVNTILISKNQSVIYLNHLALDCRFINRFSRVAPVKIASMRRIRVVLHSLRTGREFLFHSLKWLPLVRSSQKSKGVRKWNKQRRQQLIFWLTCYEYSRSHRIAFALRVETWEENLILIQVALFWTPLLLAHRFNYNKFRSSRSSKKLWIKVLVAFVTSV